LILGSGIGKKPRSGSGTNNPDHISESIETIFLVKFSNSFMRIRHEKKFGSGIKIPDQQHW
jgi:phage baseplate assembly protein W